MGLMHSDDLIYVWTAAKVLDIDTPPSLSSLSPETYQFPNKKLILAGSQYMLLQT